MGSGIFDSLATLTLRYSLMPKLYLEAVSGSTRH
jgi:translocation and assembly module TamB